MITLSLEYLCLENLKQNNTQVLEYNDIYHSTVYGEILARVKFRKLASNFSET